MKPMISRLHYRLMALFRRLNFRSAKRSNGDLSNSQHSLIAYSIWENEAPPIVPAFSAREWMQSTNGANATRCLPLKIANQTGWFILNTHTIHITWNGGMSPEDLDVQFAGPPRDGEPREEAMKPRSHFGSGIVTWTIPFLFRTPPHVNLYVRGPSNLYKKGAYPLDAIVETDWTVATFTMNWQILIKNEPVIFEANEPICMFFPLPRGYVDGFEPKLMNLSQSADIYGNHMDWVESREWALDSLLTPKERPWGGDYLKGHQPSGSAPADHQKTVNPKRFKDLRRSRV